MKQKVAELPDSDQRKALLCQIKFLKFVAGAQREDILSKLSDGTFLHYLHIDPQERRKDL